jgi:DNA invertase Pin-like site-specific DNA recombinase
MKIGYARVSTEDQNLHLQEDALKKEGCERIYTDKASSVSSERIGLNSALAFMRPGDTLVVWKLNRLSRSLKQLILTVEELNAKGIELKSLTESIDTSSPAGKLVFHVFCALAEFDRSIIQEQTRAGLKAARERGRVGGRPYKLTPQQEDMVVNLLNDIKVKPLEICRTFSINKSTLYNIRKRRLANAASS